MAYTVTFTSSTICQGALRASGSTLSVDDETARMLVDLGVATASGLSPQTGSAAAQFSDTFAAKASNLSDLTSASASRTAIGLGELATLSLSSVLQPSNNLSEITSQSSARTNLGIGDAYASSLSTKREAFDGTSTTSLITSDNLIWEQLANNVFKPYGSLSSATSGTGASASMSNSYGLTSGPNVGISGFARFQYIIPPYIAGQGITLSRWQFAGGFSCFFHLGFTPASTYTGSFIRYGIFDTTPSAGVILGDPTYASVSIRFSYETGALDLLVHNGTALTTLSLGTYTTQGIIKTIVRWDGAGNCTATVSSYLGDAVYTTTGAPANVGTSSNPYWVYQISSTGASTAVVNSYTFSPTHFFKY